MPAAALAPVLAAWMAMSTTGAFVHLALVAHRYCPVHREFEPVEPADETAGIPARDKDHGAPNGTPQHQRCVLAVFLGSSAEDEPQAVTVSEAVPNGHAAPVVFRENVYEQSSLHLVAPKHSPPSQNTPV